MELIADGLLIAAAGTAALYCWVLSRRLTALKDLDKGLGGAIASLSAQVDETRTSLADAKSTTREQSREMQDLTRRAEAAAAKLEMILAAVQEKQASKPSSSAKQTASHAKQLRENTEVGKSPNPAISANLKDKPEAQGILAEFEPSPGLKASAASATELPTKVTANVVEDPLSRKISKNEGNAEAKSALITRLRGLAQATAS